MKKIITLTLLALLLAVTLILPVSHARPVSGTVSDKLGSYTGAGSAQGHNIKASLDLAHTDLDALIATGVDLQGLLGLGGVGVVWYVDSTATGTDAGTSWTNACPTLEEAIVLALAGTGDDGDIILVAAGHAETLTAADDVDFDVAGVIAFGLGTGENRPTFTYTTNGEVVIGADDVEIHNMNFIAGNAVAHAIDVETGSENWIINNCRFAVTTLDTDEFTDCITTTADSDNGKITNCRFEMGAASADAAIQNVGCDFVEISNNIFTGDYATACIEDKTTASIWLIIKDNVLVNGTGGTFGLNTVACISLKADSTAIITDNQLFCDVDNSSLAIVAADGLLSGNTYCEAEGTAADSFPIGGDYAGVKCAYVQPASIAAVTNLFAVTGGPIIIRDIVGVVTTNIVATGCLINYNIDPTEPATDTVFGTDATALEINGDAAGTVYTWDGVVATDLTATTNGVLLTQGTDVSNGLLVPEGMIEPAATATNAGVVAFYMVYSPLSPQSTVIPQ